MAVGVNIVSTFDSKGIAKAIKDFQKLEGAGNKATFGLKTFDRAMTNGIKNLAKFGGAAAIAGAIISKSLLNSASNLQESISKINAVFGASSKSIVAWSETTAKALGISQRTALEAAGTYGNLFQAFGLSAPQAKEMSIRLVELAADMASFNNVPIDDALIALRSGLSGETEPLKRFGVALNDVALKNKALEMGLISNTKGVLPQAIKTQAAYALILEQTALQQGDVARTSDGVAFKMKSFGAQVEDIKSQIGTALIPIFSALMSFLNDKVIPVFQEFSDILGEEGLGAAFKYLGGQMFNAIGNMGKFGDALLVLGSIFVTIRLLVIAATIAQNLFNVALLANPIGIFVAAAIALGVALAALYVRFESVRKVINILGTVLKTAFLNVIEAVYNAFAMLYNGVAQGINLLIKAANLFGADIPEIEMLGYRAFTVIGNAAEKANKQIGATKKSIDTYGSRMEALAATFKKDGVNETVFGGGGGGGGKTIETAKEKLQKYIDALKGMSSAQKSARDADKSLMKSRTALAEATTKLSDAQAYFNQVVAGYGANSKQAKDRQVALRKAQGALERAGYDVEESLFAVTRAEKELAAVRLDPESSAQAIREAEISLAEAKLGVKDATEAQVEATDALAEAEQLLDEAVNGAKEGSDAYTEALEKLNDAKKAQVDATDAVTEALERQADALERLAEAEEKALAARVGGAKAAAAEAKYGIRYSTGTSIGAGVAEMAAVARGVLTQDQADALAMRRVGFTPFATGGIVTGPTRALIGEAGPEAVIPLDKLQSGMTVNVTINAGMGTDPAKLGDEIVDVLTRYQRRNGALPLKVA